MSGGTILVVDDDRTIADVLSRYLTESGLLVRTAGTAEAAMTELRKGTIDVMLLDVGLPDIDGWELTRRIRNDDRLSNTPIIMITARVDDADKIVGLEVGADDYVTKPFNAREVVARVRAQLRRTDRLGLPARTTIEIDHLRLDVHATELFSNGDEVSLTATEFKILSTLMENPGYTFRRDELLRVAVGHGYEGFDRTLNTHILNLRKKIEPSPTEPVYIQTVHGIGYRFRRPR